MPPLPDSAPPKRDGGAPAPNAEIRLRPRASTIYTSRSRTILATSPDGFVFDHHEHGLWVHQCRMLSRYRWLVNSRPPLLSVNSNLEQHRWLGYYIAPPAEDPDADPAQQTIELRLARTIAGGLIEEVAVTNFTQRPSAIGLALEVDSDFADLQEATAGRRQQHGRLRRVWSIAEDGAAELDFDYRVHHAYHHQGHVGVARMHCGIHLIARAADGAAPVYRRHRLAFQIQLPPAATWRARLHWVPRIEGQPLEDDATAADWDRKRALFFAAATHFSLPASPLAAVADRALRQSASDLAAMRLYDLDTSHATRPGWITSAGLPAYLAVFGRDTLFASRQAFLLSPEMSQGTLPVLARSQASASNRWRDAQPGKIVHELHTNPLAALNYTPHGRYYGGVTGAIAFGAMVAELWRWTGDLEPLRPLAATALRALAWVDRDGDIDGDGFCEYLTRSRQGEKNQGWKDSSDAIVYADGTQVADPLGTCEMQGWIYASKLQLSDLLWWLGERRLSRKLARQAAELRQRFNQKFWMPDAGTFAMGLDARKRLITSIASDPGHCLASGIVDPERERQVAERLMAPDMFSGWGVRTLSALHPAYNPYAYHRGTVWPVENAFCARAFARAGCYDLLHTLTAAQLEAAALFDFCRLPELFAGHPRDADHPFPAQYPRANWPQAWSASAVFTHFEAMLGVVPYAPLQVLFLDPHLPPWLPEITLRGLRIGRATVSLRFFAAAGASHFEALEQRGPLAILRHPRPWNLMELGADRVQAAVADLLPARAA